MDHEERLNRAKKRVSELKAFYQHFFIYVIVMGVLFIIDWQDGNNWWFYWPLLGWGIGVAFHAVSTFGVFGVFGPDWEERKIKQLIQKDDEDDSEPPA
ncbi:2TM domain-containing protein [Candidatus Bipolaricaulota bacterium]